MATSDDTARLIVSIEANQRAFAKQMQTVAKQSADAAKYIEDNFKKANDNVANSFQRGGRQATASVRQQSAAVSNLSFQLNDIAMQLASGTSPFTVMVQQGSQVAQVFNSAGGGGLIGAVRVLGGAFAQMVNPVSLASFALIGLTGYAVQYLTTLGDDVPDANKLLQEHANLIKSFDEAYGVAAEGVRKYSDATKQLQLQKLKDEFGSLRDAARAAADDISSEILGLSVDAFQGATRTVSDFDAALRLLEKDTPDFQQFALAMANIEQSQAPANIRELARQLRLSAQESVGLQEAIDKTQSRLNVLRLSGDEAKSAFENLTSIALGFGTAGSDAVGKVVDKIRNDLIPATVAAIGKFAEYAKNFRSIQDQVNQTPLGQLSPVFSGGGRFMNEGEAQDYRAGQTKSQTQQEQEKAAKSLASSAKTVKDSFDGLNGTVSRYVNQVVKAESGGNASARNPNSSATGLGQFIESTWLTLFKQNFPDRAKSMSDATILALRTDADISRRMIEAYAQQNAEILRQAGVSVNEAALHLAHFLGPGGAVSVLKAAPGTPVAGLLSQGAINANPTILGGGATVDDVIAYANQRAQSYENMADATKQAAQAQKQLNQETQQFQSFGQDLVGGFIQDLRNGASAADALRNALNKVLDKVIEISLQNLFGGLGGLGGGGGGLLGGFLIPGILHKGGVAGSDGYGHGRAVSPRVFAGAKRYHSGGVAGLQPGEVPAILQRGEVVVPRGTKMGSQGVHVTVGVSADNNGNLLPFVESVSDGTVDRKAPGIVSASVSRANKSAPAAVGRYQLEKAGGDYRNS